MHNSLQIEEAAAILLARRDSGNWSPADEMELTAWLEASTAHRVAYLRLENAWERARALRANAATTQAQEVLPNPPVDKQTSG